MKTAFVFLAILATAYAACDSPTGGKFNTFRIKDLSFFYSIPFDICMIDDHAIQLHDLLPPPPFYHMCVICLYIIRSNDPYKFIYIYSCYMYIDRYVYYNVQR